MTLLEQASDFQQKAAGPDIMDAVDTYYAEDITIVEGNGETFHGRDTQKGRIAEWMESVEEIHGGEITSIAANETAPGTGVVFVETSSDITFKGAGRVNMEEVAVQQWNDGKVTHERFYFDTKGAGM
ncbi:MAG: nuclear transport factor 2 family protein [Bacteroidota bacterium]